METTRQSLGERILQIRKRIGLNQTAFGGLLGGIKKSPISAYEKGDAYPRPDTLAQIAKIGQVSLDWLITGCELTATHEGVASLPKNSGASATTKPVEEDIPSHAEAANEGINVHQGMMIASKVLSSKTGYAKALWENLKSFEAAVDKEIEVEDLKRDVREMKEMMKAMLNNQAAQGDWYEKKSCAQ